MVVVSQTKGCMETLSAIHVTTTRLKFVNFGGNIGVYSDLSLSMAEEGTDHTYYKSQIL